MSKKSTVGRRWLVINLAILLAILLLWSGCEAPDSMYVRSTAGTPVHIYVDNADEFPEGGGGSGDMLKADYDPDEDFVIALAQLDAGIATITMLTTHESDASTHGVAQVAGVADIVTHSGLTTGVHGVGAGTVAKTADITATKLDDFTAPDENTDLNASTSKHGLLPKLDNTATNFLNGTGAWSVPAGGGGGLGYSLQGSLNTLNPVDNTTYYVGLASTTTIDGLTDALGRIYIPKAGTIKYAWIIWCYSASAGSDENISTYIRLNASSDTLIQTVGNSSNPRVFSNASLSISVVQGDYIVIKVVNPAWATNPSTGTIISWVIYIE
jgi:hypothetical protein